MKKLFFALLLQSFIAMSYASIVNLDMNIKLVKDKISIHKKINVNVDLDKEFEVSLGNQEIPIKLKLTPTQDSGKINQLSINTNYDDDIILLEGIIQMKEGKEEKTLASPKVLTIMGQEAMMSMQSDDGEYYEITILPQTL